MNRTDAKGQKRWWRQKVGEGKSGKSGKKRIWGGKDYDITKTVKTNTVMYFLMYWNADEDKLQSRKRGFLEATDLEFYSKRTKNEKS